MNRSEEPSDTLSTKPATGERLVVLMAEDDYARRAGSEIDLGDLWKNLWRGKWLVLGVAGIFAAASITYALLAAEWYRAEVLLAPAEEKATPAIAGQLGGLAALAGVSVGGGDSAEAIATLKSRDLARAFIQEMDLLPILFPDKWDRAGERWRSPNSAEWPDIRDGVRYFQKNVLRVREDAQTGLVTLGVEWTDPFVAAEWADLLVRRLNARLRERARIEAEANVVFLQGELAQTGAVALQQSIGRLLESEMQKLMLARGNEEFAFRIIDGAEVPKRRARPQGALITMLGTTLGGVLGLLIVFVRHAARKREL